ncbi:MAG: NAD-dependent epimerase/dehydratase family protein [Deltaproteobacteria bacterium]|nr:MAG: NAD-dependent epimerase/dehydratase family protein [Deltaproteobacteria bacterium]
MRFLVTGATAFAGCHLAQLLLNEGHEVWCTSRRTNGSESDVLDIMPVEDFEKIKWVFCDLLDKHSCREVFSKAMFDGVFHLAAQSHPPTGFALPFYTQAVNVVGTLNLLNGMMKFQPDTRFMFCSTSEVYGAPDLQEGERITEDWPLTTVNPYASSKAMIDIFLQERIRNGAIDGFITRAFSHTGPRRGKIFSISSDAYQIARILAGKQEPVIRVGNLKSRRAVMDVRDCVRAYYCLMVACSSGVFNVGADVCHPMSFFLDEMLRLYDLKHEVRLEVDQKLYRPIDIPVQVPDTSRLKATVNWNPQYALSATLVDLVEYWRAKVG